MAAQQTAIPNLETLYMAWREAQAARAKGRACPICAEAGECDCIPSMALRLLPRLWDRYVDLFGVTAPASRERLREGWCSREID